MNPLASCKTLVGLILVVTSAVLLPPSTSAQSAARPDRGLVPGASYSVSDTETISLTNGNLNLSIPLASLPPIAGGKLNFSLNAIYNSKLWNITRVEHQLPPLSNCGHWVVDTPQLGDAGGWRIGGGYQIVFRDARDDFDYYIPNPPPPDDPCFGDLADQIARQNRYYRAVLIGPDGAEHELRPVDHANSAYSGTGSSFLFNHFSATPETVGSSMRYYSVDGSYLWAVINPSSNPVRWTVYLNDGTKVTQYSDGIQRISDTNGNSIKIFGDAEGGHIQDEQTGREIKTIYDPAANGGWGQLQIIYRTVTGIEKTIQINYGFTQVQGIVYPVQDWNPMGGETGGGMVCQRDAVLSTQVYVIRSIVFPETEPGVAPRRFEFDYNSDTTATVTDEVRWACMTMPEQYTRAASKGLGTLSEMTTPTGAVVKYEYSRDETYTYIFTSDDIPRETVRKKIVAHDGTSEEWNYDIIEFNACGGTVTGPDGSVTTESCEPRDSGYGNYSMSNPKGGLVLRTNNSNKVLVERHWTLLKFNGANGMATGAYGEIPFNPVVDAEYTTLLEGDPAQAVKMSAKTFQYDFNGNLILQTEYDWFDPTGIPRDAAGVPTGVPAGTPILRVTNNAYYNDSTSPYSTNVYAKRSFGAAPLILNAVQQSSTGPAIAQLSYDGQPFGSPPTTVGNLTGKRVWDSVAEDWITTSSAYDSYGNVIQATDGRGKITTIGYATPALGLPTSVTVDPQNGTGQQTTYTAYDYSTGLVTGTTDTNNNTSQISYVNHLLGSVDPFGRPGLVIGPVVNVGGVNQRHQTKTFYADASRTVTTVSDLNTEGDGLLKGQVISDELGRAIESRQYETANDFIAVRKSYDIPARLSKTSNPFRATDPIVWTTTTADVLGRVISLMTPDNAVVATAYEANFTTVTDQAGKVRRSMVDGLGRLIRVDEPHKDSGLLGLITEPIQPTCYEYNDLGNLTKVIQGTQLDPATGRCALNGSQQRTFSYDSLSRLRMAVNPESGTISYDYDDNGNLTSKTDARSITATYVYDSLNRVTSRSYSDGTPAVSYVYDTGCPTCNTRGKLISVSSSVSAFGFAGYDALGRPGNGTQTIGTQNYTTSYAYDLAGHVKTMIYPSGRTVTNTYDNAGRLSSFSGDLGDGNPRTYANEFQYTAMNGMQQEKFGTGTAIYHKQRFNSRGQLWDMRASTVPFSTDPANGDRGAIVNYYSNNFVQGGSGSDNNGNLLRQENHIPGSSFFQDTFSYDALNRLTSIGEKLNGAGNDTFKQSYTYDSWGNRLIDTDPAKTFGTGINNKLFAVNPANNRLAVPVGQSGTMSYDSVGNLVTDTYSGSAVTRVYDAENKMTSETTYNSVVAGSYSYDGDGRRVKRVVGGIETWQVYGLGGELIAEYAANASHLSPQKEYGYRNGELLITATVTTGWGAPPSYTGPNPLSTGDQIKLENLTELRTAVNSLRSHAGLTAFNFTVDPNPQQNVTTVKADHIRQLRTALEEARLELGLSTGGYAHPTLTENFTLIYAVDFQELRGQVLSAWQSGGGVDIRWLVSDHLGTPRMVFDQTGSLETVSRHDYLPFGEEVPGNLRTGIPGYGTGDNVRQKFTSKERDNETGLDYFLARYYSSTQGRFTSPDPFGGSGFVSVPQSWNKYTYCLNRPFVFTDPSGLIWLTTDDQNYIWVDDKEYEQDKEKWKDYRVGNGATVQYGSSTACAECAGYQRGSWVQLNGDGTVSQVADPTTNIYYMHSDEEIATQIYAALGTVRVSSDLYGPKNGSRTFYNKGGGRTERWFDNDGRAMVDIDHGHPHGDAGDPHVHWWDWTADWPSRGEGAPIPQGWEYGQWDDGSPALNPNGAPHTNPRSFPGIPAYPMPNGVPVRPGVPLRPMVPLRPILVP